MGYKLTCRDLETSDCPYVARSETMEELTADIAKHFKVVHGYTEEQLEIHREDMIKKIKAVVKQE